MKKRIEKLETAIGPAPKPRNLDEPIPREMAEALCKVYGAPGDEPDYSCTHRDMLVSFAKVYGPEVLDDVEREHGAKVRVEIERAVEAEGGYFPR